MGRYIRNDDKSIIDEVADKVIADADMFRSIMELGVLGQCTASIVVTI